MSYMMPPPTQTRRYSEVHHPLQQSAPTAQPPHDVSFPFPPTAPLPDISHVTSAYTTDDSYAATGMAGDVSIGAPPFFGWQVYNIVPLNQLRKKLAKNSKGPPPKASVLAAVLSWEQQETSKGLITQVVLMDDTSQSVTLVLWKAAGVEITKAIRRGDIIYAEALKVSEFNKVLQLTFNERDSTLGICWRTYVDDPDDEAYRFHHAWRGQMPQVDAVLKQAEWFAKWSDRV
ncbi:hypothetical protein Rhopal_001521-T1 [Rhodotorula paludigena]|uniref:Uncharacterized protein n=1 Tax=Rhodotorula paludigena TaxID=86838 RepID=A0AAV5GFP6_9BASI|nr:hypothetical protein Rhopal_001521-T1 [Rhodotorula paludigena]